MVKVRAAILLAGFLGAVAPVVRAVPVAAPSSPPSGAPTPVWKQIYEDSQTIYYVGATSLAQTGEADTASLLEYKIPQVVGSAQVWSVVSRMKLNCGERQIITVDNTSYALQMGTGTAVQSQDANDAWHTPEPGSLGELIWSTACGKN
jgi:hypothetical protein